MRLSSRVTRWLFSAAVLTLGVGSTAQAQTFSYAAAYIENWSGCDSGCNTASRLRYTDDQINKFDSAMSSRGHWLRHKFSNSLVWASDYVEDRDFSGGDRWYSDDSDIVVFSGHGGAGTDSGGQTFRAPMCRRGSVSSCRYDSSMSRFGERSGYYSSPSQGNTRWLMLLTCYSAHTAPHQQWGEAFSLGLEYLMGYRDTSLDSATTDEVGRDWVRVAIGGNQRFKPAWFWAIEDWWANDTGEVVSTGAQSWGSDNRRDNQVKTWGRRPATEWGSWISWSWHRG